MAECAVYTVSSSSLDLSIKSVFTCKLCLTECTILDMYTLGGCRCQFCTMCMQQYLTVMIMEGSVLSLTCPDGQCPTLGEIREHEIQSLVDPLLFERYKRIKFLREVDLDPSRTFCPTVRCENVCRVQAIEMVEMTQFAPRAITCSKCSTIFCSVCKAAWHPEQTCDEAMRSSGRKEDEGIPFNNTEDSDIKRCPLCHVPIERNDGCAQMMCKQCKHVFCWYCLESLDDDFLLRHYDSGPCKNKLGHSRASIAWHRTQVVGIFAGFGLLLLVASPFLLLAAPCILCCKCNLCNCCDDESETDAIPYT